MFWFLEKIKSILGIEKVVATTDVTNADSKSVDAELQPYEDIIAEALKVKYFVVVFYSADWCGPCRMMDHSLKEYCLKHSIEFVRINTNLYNEQCMANGIKVIPYMELYIGGKLEKSFTGAFNVNEIDSYTQPHMEDWING